MSKIKVTIELEPGQAAGLKRFAEKVSHSDAMAVLYPHVSPDLREEQAYEIIAAFSVIQKTLDDADVRTWPWIEMGTIGEDHA